MSSKIIINKINNSTCNFVTNTDALITLKKKGVSEEVIDAMVNKSVSTSASSSSSPATTGTATESAAPASAADQSTIATLKSQGSGIYYIQPSNNSLVEAEPTVFSQEKNNHNYWGEYWSYGFAKSKKIMSVSSSHANAQFDIKKPVFYFYFNPDNNSLNTQAGSWYANASSPNEFLLVKFNTKVKNSRAVTTASHNSYESAAGIDDEFKKEFKYKKIEKGIYQVYFENDLEAGEYGFMYAGASATNTGASPKVYDFGIK